MRTWYAFYKTAQIWKTDEDNTGFSGNIKNVYELEYKRSALKNYPFKGMPERQENILFHLEMELESLIEDIVEDLNNVFDGWLEKHAILEPDQWAAQRAKDQVELIEQGATDDTPFSAVSYEFFRYTLSDNQASFFCGPVEINKAFSLMLSNAMGRPNDFPALFGCLESIYLPDYKEHMVNTLHDEGLDEFKSIHRKHFESTDEAEEYIYDMKISDVDVESLLYFESPDQAWESINYCCNGIAVAQEFYQRFVFPAWYEHWSAMGIDETRENVESVAENLRNIDSENISESMATINIALTTAHQTGDMSDYYADHIEDVGPDDVNEVLLDMTNGVMNSQWDQELLEVGVQIPEIILGNNALRSRPEQQNALGIGSSSNQVSS